MTDWWRWHDDYADPSSDLSLRLDVVQQQVRIWLDAQPAGPLRLVSVCAGQGHDVVGALHDHPRRDDVSGLLVELVPDNVAVARAALRGAGLGGVRAVRADAGTTTSYSEVVPADLLLVCGVFGNIVDDDVRRTIRVLPMLSAAGATVIWTRHRREPDLTPTIRGWFRESEFEETGFHSPGPGRFSVGVHRYAGAPVVHQPDVAMFAFTR